MMRWALIGASTIAAQYMIRAMRAQPDGEVVRVVSGSAERGAAYAETHGIATSGTDLDTALADASVDAVYISTTNEKHFAQAMAAIDAGKHVLCEKPLAMTLADAAAMVRAAETAGVVFATNHHLRCSGSHRAVRDLIAQGRVGRVLSLRVHHAVYLPENLQGWRIKAAEAGGGVTPDITVHDADVTRFLLGEDPETVVGQIGETGLGQGVEDSAMSVWSMPSGAMVMSHESFTHPFAGSGVEVHGTEGSIFARGVMTQNPVGEIELVTAEGREAVPFDDHDLYVEGVRLFAEAVAGRGQPAATGWDGVKSLAVALAVREAALSGVRQTVDYGDAK
ncbi:Gfo/Idh/MocA family oxidoreductase [Oricola sp.]|uniref:Gfo/Idh/MocA family protein n=1 Tax=Oricola sp. TaxID=1979950 RepID=UPI00260014E6|nr:Gfo/Idh/MocA family oxidoreductase [Oricola sp.]MCI5075230.1 Gfo/Idh/MocA family oxidoreductase [Oricola sp.]